MSSFKCSFPSWAAARNNQYHMPMTRHINELLGFIHPRKKLSVVESAQLGGLPSRLGERHTPWICWAGYARWCKSKN